jgi:hypothetical protein
MTAIPGNRAYWCENCESVIDSAQSCPRCATTHNIFPVANWFNRSNSNGLQAHLGSVNNPR